MKDLSKDQFLQVLRDFRPGQITNQDAWDILAFVQLKKNGVTWKEVHSSLVNWEPALVTIKPTVLSRHFIDLKQKRQKLQKNQTQDAGIAKYNAHLKDNFVLKLNQQKESTIERPHNQSDPEVEELWGRPQRRTLEKWAVPSVFPWTRVPLQNSWSSQQQLQGDLDSCEQTEMAMQRRGAPTKYANDGETKRMRLMQQHQNLYCIDIGSNNKEKWESMKQHANTTSNADFARILLDLYERLHGSSQGDIHAENTSFSSDAWAIAASNSQKGTHANADDEGTMSGDDTEGNTKEEDHENYNQARNTQTKQSVNNIHVSDFIKTEPVEQTKSLTSGSVEAVTVKIENVISNNGEENQTDLKTNTGNEGYTCYTCRRGFAQMDKLTEHLQTHTAETPYGCNICGENVNDISSLKAHMRVHAVKIPYKCGVCESCFVDSTALKMHLKKHWTENV